MQSQTYMCPSVILGSDSFISFLSGSIPFEKETKRYLTIRKQVYLISCAPRIKICVTAKTDLCIANFHGHKFSIN